MLRSVLNLFLFRKLRPSTGGVTMTDVVLSNFDEEMFRHIAETVESASFLAIDCEFSGLTATPTSSSGNLYYDTPKNRYEAHLRPNASKFLLLQFGLSAFSRSKSSKYVNKTFNFYVWPRTTSNSSGCPDPRFLCQTSSIDFLISRNFDFNKLFSQGIPYLRLSDVASLRKTIQEKKEAECRGRVSSSCVPVPAEHKEWVDSTLKRIDDYVKNPDANEGPLEFVVTNGFQRKLLYQSVNEIYDNDAHDSVELDDFVPHLETVSRRSITVTRIKRRDLAEKRNSKYETQFRELETAIGFSKIIDVIIKSRKPIVGHNLMMDLCFTLNHFVAPLPEDYDEFKGMCERTFPVIYDTKVMASTSPIKEPLLETSTVLEDLKEGLSRSPFRWPELESSSKPYEDSSSSTTTSAKYHEAGYDSYITGMCFVSMMTYLSDRVSSKVHDPIDLKVMEPFRNKIFVYRLNDIPYLNLGGKDIVPDRSHVFHLRFPSIWKLNDINSLFSRFGQVQVSWIDDTSAYVALQQREFAGQVMEALNCSSVYSIRPFDDDESSTTAITPVLEKSNISKKRSVSLYPTSLKRSKSQTEEKAIEKVFAESNNWE